MKSAAEVLEILNNKEKIEDDRVTLKRWAEEIIEEVLSYDWHTTTWEQNREQIRTIKWKL